MKRLQSDLLLFLVALIWGTAFAFQRSAAGTTSPLAFNGARFLLAGLLLLPLALRSRSRDTQPAAARPPYLWAGVTGVVLFIASLLQQVGIRYTTAGNACFLTSLYVVLIPMILLGLHLGRNWSPLRALHVAINPDELPNLLTWLAVLLAAVGVYLLSGAGGTFLPGQALGDGLEVVGAIFWALHVILVGKVVRRMDVGLFMAGQFLVSGLLNLVATVSFESFSPVSLLPAAGAILYTGVLSIGIGFTLQAAAQRHAPPADTALILSMESVFAAVSGWILLGERIDLLQILGCGLILGGILLAQFNRSPRPAPEAGQSLPAREDAPSHRLESAREQTAGKAHL